ncbi:1-acyl-sn-glycerol-3-phosphate acyltransferase [bacterium]|nr:1-acyl-sn-glycerol-3-phosphate acyltransferase [bacterium]
MKKFQKILLSIFTVLYVLIYIPFFIAIFLPLPLIWATRIFGQSFHRKMVSIVPKIWGKITIYLTLSPVKIIGRENIPKSAGNVVYIVNHQSFFDIPILLGWVDNRIRFVAKAELFKIPILGQWMKLMNCVPVSRKVSREELKKFNKIAQYLSSGGIIVVFPEGTRSADGSLQKFHPSSFRPARNAKSKIVPVRIIGSFKLFPRNRKYIKPSRIIVEIGKPVELAEYSNMTPAQLSGRFRLFFVHPSPVRVFSLRCVPCR